MKTFLRVSRFSRHSLHKLGLGRHAKAGYLQQMLASRARARARRSSLRLRRNGGAM